jgi:hypothetical protein
VSAPRQPPPPVIDSARLLSYAFTDDDDVEFTDRINLHTSEGRLGRVPCLAITLNYYIPGDVLLEFCDTDWTSKGVIAFTSVEEARTKAERGYRGITNKWIESPYSDAQVSDFLRDVYEVDPKAEWWKTMCSFCGKDIDEGQLVVGLRATICSKCIHELYATLKGNDA